MKILLDAMGGDNAPDAVIKGAVKAANEIKSEISFDENLSFLSNYHVSFAITLYPKMEYINKVKKFEELCKKKYPKLDISIKGIRPYFGKYDYNFKGTNNPDDFYYLCEKSH